MANVADFRLIEIEDFPKTGSLSGAGVEYIPVVKADGITYAISTLDLKAFLGVDALLQMGGAVTPSSVPEPEGDLFWVASESGTYTAFGGLVVPENSLAIISRVDGNYTASITPIEPQENKIKDWVAGTYQAGTIKKDINKFEYRVKSDVPTTTQRPINGVDWEVIGNYATVNVDDMNVEKAGAFLTPTEARGALPIPLRIPNMKIRYTQPYGYKEEYLGTGGFNTGDTFWKEDTDKKWIDFQNRILRPMNKIDPRGDNAFVSKFISFTENLVVENFFVESGSTLVCAAYNLNNVYIGDVTDATLVGGKNTRTLTFATVNGLLPGIAYLVFNARLFDGFKAYTVSAGSFPVILGDETRKLIKETSVASYYNEDGFVSKSTGSISVSSSYKSSLYMRILDLNNLYISGFSGATNDVALATFYDINLNRLGFYNTETQGDVNNVKVPTDSIPSGSVFVKTSRRATQTLQVLEGVEKESFIKTNQDIINGLFNKVPGLVTAQVNDTDASLFSEAGYVNKTNGLVSAGADYRSSIFLKITDRANVRITGYSGLSNNAALASFYDVYLNWLGYYNAGVNGNVTNQLVPEASIPADAYFLKATRNRLQTPLITGVEKRVSNKTVQELIANATPSGVSNRSSTPNVNTGGQIKLINYLGNTQNIHPKVLHFPNGWNGYNFWVGYTPYPNGLTADENPCIAVSNNGETFTTPPGLTNPLDPTPAFGYNSDTHLVFREDLNRLELWWRPYNIALASDMLLRRTTLDGVNWTPAEVIFDTDDDQHISPSIIFEDGKYKMWSVRSGVIHYQETVTADPTGEWTAKVTLPIAFSNTVYAWHADVIHSAKGYEFVIQCNDNPGNGNSSDLYYVLQVGETFTEPVKIVSRGDTVTDIDYGTIYRSSIVYIDGVYWIYYSCTNSSTTRAMCLTKGRDILELRGVNL